MLSTTFTCLYLLRDLGSHPVFPHPEHGHPRRSLPNMSRLQYPQPTSHSSDSSLEHQSADSMDDLNIAPETRCNSRLPAPGFRSASPSLGGLRPGFAGARAASPQRSGLPTPRRGIPRPASAAVRSSLPQPRRSGGVVLVFGFLYLKVLYFLHGEGGGGFFFKVTYFCIFE